MVFSIIARTKPTLARLLQLPTWHVDFGGQDDAEFVIIIIIIVVGILDFKFSQIYFSSLSEDVDEDVESFVNVKRKEVPRSSSKFQTRMVYMSNKSVLL
jgi:hypothetical protein